MNDQTQVKTDDELIAEFMGQTGLTKVFRGKIVPYIPSYEYWNNLMPVIEKISQHVYDSQEEDDGTGTMRLIEYRAYPRTFGMISTEGKWLFRFNRMPLEEGDTLMEAAYNAVVEFIKMPKV